MSFVNPQAFFLLLTIPAILLFHLFRAERREVRVTTLRFWDPVSPEREASGTYLRMPRLDLLLLLQVLAVLLITLALARPTVTSVVHGWPRIVLIIDTSASMKATDVPGGRFAAARDEAMAVVAGLKPHQQAMLLEASSRPAVLVPFTGDREVLTSALEALQPTDGPASLDEAIETASQLVKDGLPAEIRLFTDASFPGIAPPKPGAPPLKWHTVGRRTENVGITTLEVRRTPSAGSDYQVYVAVSNFSPERKNFSFSLMLDGTLLYEQQVSLSGEVTRSFVVSLTDKAGGVIRAEIDPHDDLTVDDVAHAVLPEPFPLKVLLVTRGNLFLEEALRAEAVVELETIIPELFVAGADGADVVVLDDMSLDSLPPGRYLLIRTLSGDAPLQHLGSVELPSIIDWDRDHPVMRYVDLSKVVIQQAMKVRPVGGGKPLAESNETPLIYAWDEGSVRAIFVGFDLYQSDIPIRVAFPLFVNNALRWLYPGRLEKVRPQLRPGEPIEIHAGTNAERATIRGPDGRSTPVFIEEGRLVYDGTRSAGLYAVRLGELERLYAINMLDENESNLTPGRGVPDEVGEGKGAGANYRAPWELWWFLAWLALLVLAAETFLYLHRVWGSVSLPSLLVRTGVLFLVALSLFRYQVSVGSDAIHVAFLLDHSDSVPSEEKRQILEKAQAAMRGRGTHDTANLVVFGSEASLQDMPEHDAGPPQVPPTITDGHATDIARAIRLALASLPREGTRRILLMSDGNENRGSSLEAAREAKRGGVEIYTVPIGGPAAGESLLYQMVLPREARLGEPFDIWIVAWSAQGGNGKLSLYRDGSFVAAQPVRLEAGKNLFSYQDSHEIEGFQVYQARLEVPNDVVEENNRAVGVVAIRGQPRVLYVERDREQGRHLVEALKAQRIQVDQVGRDGIPDALARLSEYDSLILSNVSALNLTKSQTEQVQSYVRDKGGGLIMLGGEESFGLGGYYRTPIEEALPVTMETRRKVDVPSAVVVLVIDRSGSMNTEQGDLSRMDLAKEAAQLAVELLSGQSEVGVIAFDTKANWVVPIVQAKDKAAIIQQIATIKAGGGGTELLWALEEAYRGISRHEAMLRHVIIVSDGETRRAGFAELLEQMAHDKITVSSVAISSEAGVELLRDISRWGAGRSYFTGDAYNVPRIFTMETLLASKAGLVEQRFRPVVRRRYHEILKGIDWGKVPPLGGYVTTTPKEMAETLLVSHQQDPILSVWRYGLGRTAAFTSDAKAKWGIRWLRWGDFSKFFAQLVRWTLRSGDRGGVATTVQVHDGWGQILVEVADAHGEFLNFLEGEVGVVFPDKSRTVLPLVQSGPGRYQGTFLADAQGAYLVGVSLRQGARALASEAGSAVVPYSLEHRVLSVNETLLKALAKSTGGLMLSDPLGIFRLNRERSSRAVEAWPWFLLLALLLLLVDLALRWLRGKRSAGRDRAPFSWARPRTIQKRGA